MQAAEQIQIQVAINTMKVCRNCRNSNLKSKDNMLIRVCIPNNVNKNGFESCEEFEDKQCEFCTYHESLNKTDERCRLCLTLGGKHYFEMRGVGDDS
jgi:hypothetical protein